jgi:protocatechuate 3,4-dioxygenase beta subunit
MRTDHNRRLLLLGLGGFLLAGPASAARLVATPEQTTGPFYPIEPPLTRDNDLTRVAGSQGRAKGRIADVAGQLLDVNGRPIRNARIEIWQCDANSRYHHPRDRGGAIDENFQGFGHAITDTDGRYRFRTIRPVPYPGRTPHIHVAVFADGAEPFATQLYVAGEPLNARDLLYQHIPPDRRRLVTAAFEPTQGGSGPLRAQFDIVLGAADGTPRG